MFYNGKVSRTIIKQENTTNKLFKMFFNYINYNPSPAQIYYKVEGTNTSTRILHDICQIRRTCFWSSQNVADKMAESKKTKINKESPKFHKCRPQRCVLMTRIAKMLHFNVGNVIVLFILSADNFQLIKSSYAYHL